MTGKSGEELSRHAEFSAWLKEAAFSASIKPSDRVCADPQLLESLNEDDALDIARDLDGIYDSACSIRTGLSLLLTLTPNTDDLETSLSDLEVDIAHALGHWESTLVLLRAKYDWLEDNEEE